MVAVGIYPIMQNFSALDIVEVHTSGGCPEIPQESQMPCWTSIDGPKGCFLVTPLGMYLHGMITLGLQ